VDDLPHATWEDALEAVYLQHAISEGLKKGADGRQRTVQEVRQHFGLPP
jgi:hypothetical protein